MIQSVLYRNIQKYILNVYTITKQKNRYGEADVEVGVNFFGHNGIWKELPNAEDIYDFEKYTSPDYILRADEEKIEDTPIKQSLNFTL